MAGGLLDLGDSNSGIDTTQLNQLLRPPDRWANMLAAMSQKLAEAGRPSPVRTSTLGALGSALGAASQASQAGNEQYLAQAAKVQQLRQLMQQQALYQQLQPYLKNVIAPLLAGAGATAAPGAPAAPGAIGAAPTPAIPTPGVPAAATPAAGIPAIPPRKPPPPELVTDAGGLLGDPTQGGAGAAATLASFRPDEATPLVAAANGAADRLDPTALRGLLALGGDDTGMAGGGERGGLLGSPDELIRGPAADLPIRQASASVPRSREDIVRAESGGNPNVGYGGVDLTNKPRDPETGFPQWEGRMGPAGISHAGGKYQFQPGTWAEGAKALGIKDFSEASQDAVYDWTRAKYGDAPWRASEGGGARPGMMLAQYAGGPPAGSSAAAVAQALGGAPSLVGTGGGKIPGLNATPEQLAALNALTEMAGLKTPFKDFIDLYYKSPEYLQQSEQAKATGQRAVTEPSDIRIAQQKAVEDRVTQQLKTIGDARFSLAPNGILVPDGQGGQTRVQATVEQAVRAANGLAVPELGIKGMYPDAKGAAPGGAPGETRAPGPIAGEPTGTLPPGYQWRTSPDGKVTAQPIPNTPEAAKAQELARTRAIADRQLQVARDSVVAAADRIENNVKTSTLPTTGIVGSKLTGVYQPAQDVQADIQNIEARMTLDQLNALRAGSPTGGALGAVSEGEGAKLATAMANLKQSQSKEQFLTNLQVVKQAYIDAVHGPGAWKEMSDQPVLKTQPPAREWKENDIVPYPDGSQRQLKNGEWILIKPPTQR